VRRRAGSGSGESDRGVHPIGLFFNGVKVSTAATAERTGDPPANVPELVLASTSPRRRRLLETAGLAHRAVAPRVDDSDLPMEVGQRVAERTVALAWLKGAATMHALRCEGRRSVLIVAADTLVADGDRALGKPASSDEEEQMLRILAGRDHRVWTGHAVIDLESGRRRLWVDSATVRIGALDEELLVRHLERRDWEGRAGGYSLDELEAAGWSVECSGDPEVVLGLSTAGVRRAIASLAVDAGRGA
jgi:septum formation protein